MPATRYKTVLNTGVCFQLGDFNRKVCLPIKQDCTPTAKGWLLNDCDSLYCNTFNSLVDVPFNMIYEAGDKIQFQFRLDDNYNSDPENPSEGWGTFVTGKLFRKEGTLISDDYTTFSSRSIVGYDGVSSYQIIEIDTSLLTEELCWYLQVTSHIDAEVDITQSVCTELFGIARCGTTVLIQGLYTQYDCFNNWYGDPVAFASDESFKYNNQQRFDGRLWQSPNVIKRELVSQKLKSSVLDDVYNFRIHNIIPAYVMKTCTQFFNAPIILIDGVEYQADGYTPEAADTGFIINQEVYLRCESTNNNCNT